MHKNSVPLSLPKWTTNTELTLWRSDLRWSRMNSYYWPWFKAAAFAQRAWEWKLLQEQVLCVVCVVPVSTPPRASSVSSGKKAYVVWLGETWPLQTVYWWTFLQVSRPWAVLGSQTSVLHTKITSPWHPDKEIVTISLSCVPREY